MLFIKVNINVIWIRYIYEIYFDNLYFYGNLFSLLLVKGFFIFNNYVGVINLLFVVGWFKIFVDEVIVYFLFIYLIYMIYMIYNYLLYL